MLSTLAEVSQSLSGTTQLKAALHRVLELLEKYHGSVISAVTLRNEKSDELHLEVVNGVTASNQQTRHLLGESIASRVIESGKHVVVPRISQEPLFANRSAKSKEPPKREMTFICVPIILNKKTVGALSINMNFKRERDYDRKVKFLRVVASMIAHSIKAQRIIEAERQRLLDEHIPLRQELKEKYDFSNIIGNSGPLRQVYESVSQVAHTNTTVLIRGESGTGK